MTRRKVLWASGGVAVAVVAVLGGGWALMPTQPEPPRSVHATSTLALDTPEQAAGWADDVYVGTVTHELGVEPMATNAPTGIPYTTYRVEVQSPLKGRIAGTVRVAQLGTQSPQSGQHMPVAHQPSLRPGSTYVFATRVSTQSHWHTSPVQLTPVAVTGPQDPQVDRWKQAVAQAQVPADVPASALEQGTPVEQAYQQAAVR